ncbi:hypothetical protein [Bradyrhizobium monzae]|uniref:hypothetical protein n=1 Tax=Bradyrhizobium sp. Oc8 TaxID=2876780 RepID=UPI001F1EA0A4|nr:hypothetical protein [Bradyrhizobium sp. Oc8]
MAISIKPKGETFLIFADELPVLECSDMAVAVRAVIEANQQLDEVPNGSTQGSGSICMSQSQRIDHAPTCAQRPR